MVSLVRDHGAESIHIHDLPYAKSGIRAARETGVPAVIDLHENHPAAFALWQRRFVDRVLFSPSRAARLERWAVLAADRVVVVVDEAKDRLVADGGDPAKVIVFGNMESRELAVPDPPPLDLERGLRIVYVGGVSEHRGLETAVDAMPLILAERPDARLTIVGSGDGLESLKARAARLGLEASVTFTGRLPLDEAMDAVRDANVATVPHQRSPLTDATIPHKLFQYMALGRPVLVSDCKPLARTVRATRAGEVFAAGDAADFARRAVELTDPERAEAMGAAGRAAVLGGYNLETDGAALVAAYAELEPRRGNGVADLRSPSAAAGR
jgi:glycosyltransferase involved in cell wall biosynthesis